MFWLEINLKIYMLHSNLKNVHHNQQHECQTNILLVSSTPRAYKVPGTEDG